MSAMFEFKVTGLKEGIKKLENIAKQIPFAVAYGLTLTAEDAAKDLRKGLGKTFTVRNKKFVAGGIISTQASKSDLTAEVGSVHSFMERQALGGIKRSQSGRNLGVPVIGGARPRKTWSTPPKIWPRALVKLPNYFIMKRGEGPRAVYKRLKDSLKLMYLLKSSVVVPPRWPFVETVEQSVLRTWERNFTRALRWAIKTAR